MITPTRRRELIGIAELAQMLGLSKQRVYQLVGEAAFPEPAASLVMGNVWELAAVQAWAEQTQRTLSALPDPWPDKPPRGAYVRSGEGS